MTDLLILSVFLFCLKRFRINPAIQVTKFTSKMKNAYRSKLSSQYPLTRIPKNRSKKVSLSGFAKPANIMDVIINAQLIPDIHHTALITASGPLRLSINVFFSSAISHHLLTLYVNSPGKSTTSIHSVRTPATLIQSAWQTLMPI